MSIKHVTGDRVSPGHDVYTSPDGSLDANGYVEWEPGQVGVSLGGLVNVALGINNQSGGAIAWTIYPVLKDGTVCSESADDGSIADGVSDFVFDDVLGAGEYVVHLDTAGEYVEVVLK